MRQMKRGKVVLIMAMALFVLAGASSALASSFSFDDPDGHWWTGSGKVTLTISSGSLPTITGIGSTGSGSNDVSGFLDTSDIYSLNATPGPMISAGNVWDYGNGIYSAWEIETSGHVWNGTFSYKVTLMGFIGDVTNGYGYFGISLDDIADIVKFTGISITVEDILKGNFDWDYSNFWSDILCSDCSWSRDFTFAGNVEIVYGKNCGEVPIPAAAWLLGSGLVGLMGIRRVRKKGV